MSKREAYEYTTALNTLLADRDRVQRIGDDTVISWAHCGNGVYPDLFSQWQNGSMGQSAVKLDEKTVKDATHALAQGRPYDYEGIHLSPDEKFIIPYGLYRMNGYISAKLAQNVTGFCNEDLDMLWRAILNMFEFDRSAARGNMAVRKLYVFKHSSALGDAPSWKLFDSIDVHKRDGVDVARSFGDYEVHVNRETIPDSVNVSEMVDHTL